jgi:hypothetical protein
MSVALRAGLRDMGERRQRFKLARRLATWQATSPQYF